MKANRFPRLMALLIILLLLGDWRWAAAGEQSAFRLQRSSPMEGMEKIFAQAPVAQVSNAQFTMNLAPAPTRSPQYSSVDRAVGSFVRRLNPSEARLLSSRDIIIVIDKSGSMDEKDCPSTVPLLGFVERLGGRPQSVSRFDWCASELVNLSKETASTATQAQNNMRVVLYASDIQTFDHVGWYQIPQIFSQNRPGGGTNQAAALKAQFDDYFARRARFGAVRPVIIAVITDGLPTSPSAVKSALIDATRKMQRANEIAVTFLQVGRDRKGVNLVHQLDDRLISEGSSFDIVDCKDFNELMQKGLARALVDAINEAGNLR